VALLDKYIREWQGNGADWHHRNGAMALELPQVEAHGDAKNVMREMRVRALYSPYYFVKVVLGYRKLVAHLHQHDMELFATRWSQGIKKQFVEWPRAFYKTTAFTIGMSMWGVLAMCEEDHEYALNVLGISERDWWARVALHDMDATQLFAFETQENAERKVRTVRWHLEENAMMRGVFPELAANGKETKWSDSCLMLRRTGPRRDAQEGSFEAIGVGGALQSRHYSRIFEDDLVGEKAVKSPPVMEKTRGWHGRLAGVHETAADKTQFGVSNRWGYDDLNSFIRQSEPDVVFYTRAAWELDTDPESPTFGQDRAIFPEEYPIEKLLSIRDSGSMTKYDFSCQYLNTPTMPGEKEVDASKLHTYTVGGDAIMSCSCGAKWRASQLYRYIHYDPYNAKGGGSTSCPAIVVVGTSSDGHIFLIDYFLGKENYGKIYEVLFRYNDTWRPRLFTYEDVGHQNAVAFHWTEIARTVEYKQRHKNPPRIEGVKTGNRSKELRIREGLFPAISQKKFAVRSTHVSFLKMLDTFPHRVFDHDYDLLDALAQGSTTWAYPQNAEQDQRTREEEDEYLAHFNEPYGYAGRLRA
jgi:hypothetical protein